MVRLPPAIDCFGFPAGVLPSRPVRAISAAIRRRNGTLVPLNEGSGKLVGGRVKTRPYRGVWELEIQSP